MTEASLDLLYRAPEVAILAVLEAAIEATAHALVAAHDDIGALDSLRAPAEPSVEAVLAEAVIEHLGALREAVERYRTALERRPDWDAASAIRPLF